MMKKLLAVLLALIMCLSFAACGDKKAPENNSEPVSPSTNTGNDIAPQTETETKTQNDENFTALDVKKEDRISDLKITGMKMGKDVYDVGEPIEVTVTWEGTPYDDAWIGVIPAEIAHGSEEENDAYDTEYFYLLEKNSGDTFVFEYAVSEPGTYTIRINESDGGGAELAWCGFIVADINTDALNELIDDISNSGGERGYVGNEGAALKTVDESNFPEVAKAVYGIDVSEGDGWTILDAESVNGVNDLGINATLSGSATPIELMQLYFERCLSIGDVFTEEINWDTFVLSKGTKLNSFEEFCTEEAIDTTSSYASGSWIYDYNGRGVQCTFYVSDSAMSLTFVLLG